MALCDLLLTLAEDLSGFYAPRWSADILEELRRNLVADGRCTPTQALRRLQLMNDAFPEALVEDYERLVPAMQNDDNDRHVLAAAVRGDCRFIVTHNTRHFPSAATLPYDIRPVSPDQFLQEIFTHGSAESILPMIIMNQANSLRRPELTVRHVLNALSQQIPETVKQMRSHFEGYGLMDVIHQPGDVQGT
jgi:predicted nucleic acid-binding protein